MKIASVLTFCSALVADAKMPIFLDLDRWNVSPQDLRAEFVRMAKAGVSTIILGYYVEGNAAYANRTADTVALWAQLPEEERLSIAEQLHRFGTKMLISAGGELEGSHWFDQNPKEYAERACRTIKSLNVDGVNMEKLGFQPDRIVSAVDWNIAATRRCREIWVDAIIASAPQSHYLVGYAGVGWADGFYINHDNDYYFIKYFDEGPWTNDDSYEGLVFKNGVGAIKDLWKDYRGLVRPDQFVIGKPYSCSLATSGFVNHSSLREIICKAWNEQGYKGGIMFYRVPFGQDLSDLQELSKPC